jgi:hypothetical protein
MDGSAPRSIICTVAETGHEPCPSQQTLIKLGIPGIQVDHGGQFRAATSTGEVL